MSKFKGFTLIELLVAISIIAVLAAVGFTSFQGVQGKARDAKRKSDLRALATALEIYYQKSSKYIDPAGTGSGDCTNDMSNFYTNIVSYMANNNVPKDPQTGASYCYISINSGASYQLFTKLENCSDPQVINPTTCTPADWNFSVASSDLAITPPGVVASPTPTPAPTSTPPPTPSSSCSIPFCGAAGPCSASTCGSSCGAGQFQCTAGGSQVLCCNNPSNPTPTPTPTATPAPTATPTPTPTPTPMPCTSGYQDFDKDGFGTGAFACYSPSASYNVVANNTDCYDLNANAKQGQTQYFYGDRGDGSYDYDCSGTATKDPHYNCLSTLPSPTSCTFVNNIIGEHGGYDSSIPACGQSGTTRSGIKFYHTNVCDPADYYAGTGIDCTYSVSSIDAGSWGPYIKSDPFPQTMPCH